MRYLVDFKFHSCLESHYDQVCGLSVMSFIIELNLIVCSWSSLNWPLMSCYITYIRVSRPTTKIYCQISIGQVIVGMFNRVALIWWSTGSALRTLVNIKPKHVDPAERAPFFLRRREKFWGLMCTSARKRKEKERSFACFPRAHYKN